MYSNEFYLLRYDDSTRIVLKREGEEMRRAAAQGLFVFGTDKSEVSFWIFNILQGTKQLQ